MSDAISVKCPSCKATLKLKSRSAAGKKVPCPKCKKPFVVQAPPEDDDMAFLNDLDPSEIEDHEAQEEEEAAPAPVRRSSAGTGRKSKKPQKKSGNWLKPVLIGTAVLLVLGLLGGGGYFAFTMIEFGGRNKIDLSYLAPDCELIVHARADEVLNSPLAKSVLAIPEIKKGLDDMAKEYQVSLSDVKSVTVGVKGVDLNTSAMMPMPGMGAMGPGRFGAPPRAGGAQNAQGTIVIRLSRSLPADFTSKLPATSLSKTEYHGAEYFRPLPQVAAKVPSFYIPAPDVLVAADESEVQRIIDNGPRQTRRSDFDFIDASPQIVIAMLNKQPAGGASAPGPAPGGTPGMGPGGMPPGMAMGPGMGPGNMPGAGGSMPMGMPGGGMPGGGMPGGGGMAGMNDVPSLTGGKVKAWYLGLSFTQDVDIQTGLYCPDSAAQARGELGSSIDKAKSKFKEQKGQLAMLAMFGLGDIVPFIEQTLYSIAVQPGDSPTVTVTARIPGGIKSAIEKAIPTLSAFAGGGAGGLPPGFGPGGPAGDDAPNSLGDAEPPEEVAEEPATPPTSQP